MADTVDNVTSKSSSSSSSSRTLAMLRQLDSSSPGFKYLTGPVAPATCHYDPRFCFYLYVPRHIHTSFADTQPQLPLLVLIHSTNRRVEELRELYRTFADTYGFILLLPLFPVGIFADDALNFDNYKSIAYRSIRFDHVLLHMIQQVASIYRVNTEKFHICGFSGGAQFVQRFILLHPERVHTVSIGAPGMTTLLDMKYDWPRGVKNMHDIFATEFDVESVCMTLKEVKIQLLVGSEDTDISSLKFAKQMKKKEGQDADDKVYTRVETMKNLYEHYIKLGMNVEFSIVDGVAHQGAHPKIVEEVQKFLVKALELKPYVVAQK